MTFNERTSRSSESHVKQFVARLYRQVGGVQQGSLAFAAICDMISTPRDLRAGLLAQLLAAGLVERAGDRVRLTEAGRQLAVAAPVADEAPATPSPHDRESRVRTPGSGNLPRS